MDEQALFDEMMSQPLTEDEREMVSDHLMQQAILQRDQRIAALEAKLKEQAEIMNIGIENGLKLEAELAAAQAAHAKSHEEAAGWRRMHTELLTELAPWRQMARQLEALRGEGWRVKFNWHEDGVWACFIEQVSGRVVTDRLVSHGDTLPAAVAAAYGKVAGDE